MIILYLAVKPKMFSDTTEYRNEITAKKLGYFAIQMLILTETPLSFYFTLSIPKLCYCRFLISEY